MACLQRFVKNVAAARFLLFYEYEASPQLYILDLYILIFYVSEKTVIASTIPRSFNNPGFR